MKKIIALILAILTIFSVVSVSAFAVVTDSSNAEISTFNVPLRTGTAVVAEKITVSYSNPDKINDSNAGEIITVKFDKPGTFYIDYSAVALGKSCYVELYADKTFNTIVGRSDIITSDSLIGRHDIDIPKAGVYYLVLYTYTSDYTDPYINTIDLSLYYASNADRVLKSKTWANSCYKEDGTYFRIDITKDCVVNVYSNKQDVYVKLYNSKKVELQGGRTPLKLENNFKTSYYLKKGTYYILCQNYGDEEYQIKYTTSSIASLTNKKFKTFYQAYSGLYMYMKITPKSSGYIKVTGENFSGKVWLCNSKKKVVSDYVFMDSLNDDYAVFGVEKGKTYYLRLDNYNNVGKIKYTNVAVKDSGGAKRAKAVKMPAKKWISGYVAAGDSSKDWFKFTLDSNKYFKMDIKGNVNGNLKIYVYDSEGNELDYFTYYDYEKSKYIYSYSKLEKGTYYVSVSRGNKKSSGSYSLKFTSSNKQLVK